MKWFAPLILVALFHPPLGITWVVENTNDSGLGSLRQAVISARGGDVIQFDPSLSDQTIGLTSGELLIDKNLEIQGNVTIARTTQSRFRIFDVQAGSVVLRDLTIANGYADGSFGGGIANRSTLLLQRCHVTGNVSDAGDGGGGIWNSGYLTIDQSTVDNNSAMHTVGFPLGYGGGIKTSGTLFLSETLVTANSAEVRGGGVYCNGSMVIQKSTVSGNQAPEGANIYGCGAHRK